MMLVVIGGVWQSYSTRYLVPLPELSVVLKLYQCLYGHTPFLAEEGGRQATKMNIIVSNILHRRRKV